MGNWTINMAFNCIKKVKHLIEFLFKLLFKEKIDFPFHCSLLLFYYNVNFPRRNFLITKININPPTKQQASNENNKLKTMKQKLGKFVVYGKYVCHAKQHFLEALGFVFIFCALPPDKKARIKEKFN